jgi:hypothetical protein
MNHACRSGTGGTARAGCRLPTTPQRRVYDDLPADDRAPRPSPGHRHVTDAHALADANTGAETCAREEAISRRLRPAQTKPRRDRRDHAFEGMPRGVGRAALRQRQQADHQPGSASPQPPCTHGLTFDVLLWLPSPRDAGGAATLA